MKQGSDNMVVAICDDDLRELSILRTYLEEYRTPLGEHLILDSFQNGVGLIQALKSKQYDLLIIDILMPVMTGMEAAQEIRINNDYTPIIFLTSSPEFAVESYRVRAYDYLLKPIDRKLLFSALDHISTEQTFQNDSLAIKTPKTMMIIPFSQIEVVEINNKTLQFHLSNGSIKSVNGKLSDYEDFLLQRKEFIKVHRSYIVNMNLMQSFSNQSFLSLSGLSIPISRNVLRDVKETYVSFLRDVVH